MALCDQCTNIEVDPKNLHDRWKNIFKLQQTDINLISVVARVWYGGQIKKMFHKLICCKHFQRTNFVCLDWKIKRTLRSDILRSGQFQNQPTKWIWIIFIPFQRNIEQAKNLLRFVNARLSRWCSHKSELHSSLPQWVNDLTCTCRKWISYYIRVSTTTVIDVMQ